MLEQALQVLLGAALLALPAVGGIQQILKRFGPLRTVRVMGVQQVIGVGLGIVLTLFAVGV